MPYIKDGTNNLLFIPTGDGSSGSAVNTEAYEYNLKCALIEEFKSANSLWSVTNGTLSDNGLVCNGYSKAEYQSVATLDTERAVIQFTYSSDSVIGVCLSSCIAWVDTANSVFNCGNGYAHGNVLPAVVTTAEFTFEQGNSYELVLERTLGTVGTAKIRDLVSGDESEMTVNVGLHISDIAFGVTVFSGQATINKFLYYAPILNHAKVLVIGDSITWGTGVTDKTKRWGIMLIQDYFHNNGIQCGISGIGSGGLVGLIDSIFTLGYSFDYVLVATGTNDGTPTSTSKANYEGIISSIESHGCEVIWCLPPTRSAGSHADRVNAVREVLLSIEDLKTIRFDYATSTNGEYDSKYFSDGVHTNALGSQRQYEFAKSALELWGIN